MTASTANIENGKSDMTIGRMLRLIDHLHAQGLSNRTIRHALEHGKITLDGMPTADASRDVTGHTKPGDDALSSGPGFGGDILPRVVSCCSKKRSADCTEATARSVSVIIEPAHTDDGPLSGVGAAFTVTVTEALQPPRV